MKYIIALILLASVADLQGKTTERKHYTKNVTLVGLQDGIMIYTRKRPTIVQNLQKDAKGFFYTMKNMIMIPKGWLSLFGSKKKFRKHYSYCIVCKPTTMFADQAAFVSHMKQKSHVFPRSYAVHR